MKQAFPADHAVPISKAVRAGDFVYTSAYGPWVFDPANLTYDAAGVLIDDGAGKKDMPVRPAGAQDLRLRQSSRWRSRDARSTTSSKANAG